MNVKNNIETQRLFYNQRWKHSKYANKLQLERALAIMDCLRRINLTQPRILDLGCGNGWLASILSQFGPTAGIELSTLAVERAKSMYARVHFIAGNLFELPLGESCYDVVVSQEVIEHVEGQEEYIKIAARCLKPNGYLILTTPNANTQAHIPKEELESWSAQPIENWLTPKQLKKLLIQRFNIKYSTSITLGVGRKGIWRIVNSYKLNLIIRKLGLHNIYSLMFRKLMFGLHLVVLAQKKQ